MTQSLNRWMPQALSLLRIIVGLLFLEHGTQKLLGFPPPLNPAPLSMLLVVQGWIELVGGILRIAYRIKNQKDEAVLTFLSMHLLKRREGAR